MDVTAHVHAFKRVKTLRSKGVGPANDLAVFKCEGCGKGSTKVVVHVKARMPPGGWRKR